MSAKLLIRGGDPDRLLHINLLAQVIEQQAGLTGQQLPFVLVQGEAAADAFRDGSVELGNECRIVVNEPFAQVQVERGITQELTMEG